MAFPLKAAEHLVAMPRDQRTSWPTPAALESYIKTLKHSITGRFLTYAPGFTGPGPWHRVIYATLDLNVWHTTAAVWSNQQIQRVKQEQYLKREVPQTQSKVKAYSMHASSQCEEGLVWLAHRSGRMLQRARGKKLEISYGKLQRAVD